MTTTLSVYRHPPRRRPRKTWLQRQFLLFEVTFGLYMMSPAEKLAFYTFLFLFLGFLTVAVTLYLPQHLQTVARRLLFYIFGDHGVIRNQDVLEYNSVFTEVVRVSRNAAMDTPPEFSIRHGEAMTSMGH
ncbi:hypothetical protein TWF106_007691 [Orbilia oligospora]|uniref:Uncharacterized protein n=1 Tax=Orbilia oligospora TaxID=2813651 RepID=A0A6G1LU17_ORBOL|nr:hypothetical protein TWF788_008831 [Orbilia oligospora]KAF3208285.1 hypothetical protein TWF191_000678 [Orbilia oligospora]KAF3214917.1 hypothetical protein TWF679_004695 [Orbilia oligospora]KAF3218329.1 hypothetical protein TWF106_007691 [Orbilia oligospora]KAF3232830.1 hypothetical protein TWF192_002808 [Orbilia oligospora]